MHIYQTSSIFLEFYATYVLTIKTRNKLKSRKREKKLVNSERLGFFLSVGIEARALCVVGECCPISQPAGLITVSFHSFPGDKGPICYLL